MEFPSIGSELGEDAWTFTAELAAYRKLGPVAANLSGGPLLERRLEDGTRKDLQPGFEAALAFFSPLGAFVPLIELGLERTDETEWRGALGLLFHPGEDWELGAAALSTVSGGEIGYGGALTLIKDTQLPGA